MTYDKKVNIFQHHLHKLGGPWKAMLLESQL